jgi:hypothetical protein
MPMITINSKHAPTMATTMKIQIGCSSLTTAFEAIHVILQQK